MPIPAVRVQKKGQVTIPLEIRRKLNLKKGDLVTFVDTVNGVVIKPAEVVLSETLDKIGEALKEKGVSMEDLIESGGDIRRELLEEENGISDSETE